jgi:hypothetical protein
MGLTLATQTKLDVLGRSCDVQSSSRFIVRRVEIERCVLVESQTDATRISRPHGCSPLSDSRPKSNDLSDGVCYPETNRPNAKIACAIKWHCRATLFHSRQRGRVTIIATEIPAAIRPYSMALAPDAPLIKREARLNMGLTPS